MTRVRSFVTVTSDRSKSLAFEQYISSRRHLVGSTEAVSFTDSQDRLKIQGSTTNYTPQLCLYPPSTAQSSQNFIPIVPILLVVHLVKGLSYTPRNLSLVKNLIPPGV